VGDRLITVDFAVNKLFVYCGYVAILFACYCN